MIMYKLLISFLCSLWIVTAANAQGQNISWGAVDSTQQVYVHGSLGVEYAMTYGFGGGYLIEAGPFTMLADISFSMPFGEDLFDDKKIKAGGNILWVSYAHWAFSTPVHAVFRTVENNYVQMVNFGSDMSAVAGYYRKHWFIAGEVGFDKAIATRFQHTEQYQGIYPQVVDGWHEPDTGGNFYYGVQLGVTYKQLTLGGSAGKLLQEDFTSKPMLPFYGSVSLSYLL